MKNDWDGCALEPPGSETEDQETQAQKQSRVEARRHEREAGKEGWFLFDIASGRMDDIFQKICMRYLKKYCDCVNASHSFHAESRALKRLKGKSTARGHGGEKALCRQGKEGKLDCVSV
jgi:hypothetical protein